MMHAMIDVEALRLNKPWIAPLLEIGIVLFDECGKELGSKRILVLQTELPAWAEPEPETVEFWESQDYWPKLKRDIGRLGISAMAAMMEMSAYLKKYQVDAVWFAGPQYDQIILEAYLDHYAMERPWRFNEVRDFRTIRKQYPLTDDEVRKNRRGNHEAIEDCRYQVQVLRRVFEQGYCNCRGWL